MPHSYSHNHSQYPGFSSAATAPPTASDRSHNSHDSFTDTYSSSYSQSPPQFSIPNRVPSRLSKSAMSSSHSHSQSYDRRSSRSSTSIGSKSATITCIDPAEYNPHLYNTHLFIMRLIPPIPFTSSKRHSKTGRITSDSVPQWEWSTPQCRAWLEQVLIKREKIGLQEARELGKRLQVDGSGLYGLGVEEWDEICSGSLLENLERSGRRGRRREETEKRDEGFEMGMRIWGMLKRRRREEGAVPETVRALNGW